MGMLGGAWVLIVVGAVIGGIAGWIMNIVKIVGSVADPITGLLILRCIGVVLAPLGAVLGWAEAGMREVDEMIATVSECLPGGYRDRPRKGNGMTQLSNLYEDEDFKAVIDEIEGMDAEVEEIMASARGKASKIREAQKRKKKMAKQELNIPTEILNASLKSRKLERQLQRIAQGVPEEMVELWADAAGQFSFLKPKDGENTVQAAARAEMLAQREREEAEQREGNAVLEEMASGTVLN
eukprot:jgi/Tetstr1/441001/TSEL_029269.t1